MKFTLSGSRSLAISAVAGLFGWFIVANESSDVARYAAMSKEAIVAELTSQHTGKAAALSGALIVVLGVVVGVDVLTNFFDAVWHRINPGPGGSPPPTAQ